MATWTPKVDFVDKVLASHINDLQTGKVDKDLLGYVFPEDYGAVGDGVTDDTTAIQDAIDTGGSVLLGINKTYLVSGVSITTNGQELRGRGNSSVIKLAAGASYGVYVVDSGSSNPCLNVSLRDFAVDMSSVANAIGIYGLGVWYLHVKNIWMDKTTVAASSYGLKLESGGVASGHEGSYVNLIENLVTERIWLSGDVGQTRNLTTCTIVNLDCTNVIINNADSVTFLQPVIQQSSSGYHFDLNYVSGLTCLGGDFEGNGTVYRFQNSCRNIKSIGNTLQGFSGTYSTGSAGTSSIFMDDYTSAIGFKFLGSLQPLLFQNAAWNINSSIGYQYSGDVFQIGFNCVATSASAASLYDTSYNGFLLSLSPNNVSIKYATAGANPRTLTTILTCNSSGLTIPGLSIDGSPVLDSVVLSDISFGSIPYKPAAVETIVDGGVEDWASATDLTSWWEGTSGTSTVNRDGIDFHGGLYSARLDIDASNSQAYIRSSPTLVSSKMYQLSFWYKTEANKTAYVSFVDTGFNVGLRDDGAWGGAGEILALPASTSWTQYSLTFRAHASYVNYYIYFINYVAASSSIRFDDISISSLGELVDSPLSSDGDNVGLGQTTFGASADHVIAIGNGTPPDAHVDNSIQIFSVDSSDAEATLGLMLEQTIEAASAFDADYKIKVKINGTEYWLGLEAV